ncbi:hypothetical protein [Sandaracinus amylolyticus]|uniref:hypothetical protein n=1 Tax=Sandaracinus amylolyticus TaxID=927083 RepID=UPI001F26F4CE|nr:hypothetical protein [Sandaracinus amylolyticus]UJR78580.1 Hypothetical protein I5071_6100 [Sandaracinus amylolyticus]
MNEAPTIFHRDDVLCVAAWRDVMLELWSGEGTIEHFRVVRASSRRIVDRAQGSRVCLVSSVQVPALRAVPQDVRNEMVARDREMAPHLIAAALVVSSKGFVASIVRSMLAGLQMTSQTRAPSRVFEDELSALAWLAPHVSSIGTRACTPGDLRSAMAEARGAPPTRALHVL